MISHTRGSSGRRSSTDGSSPWATRAVSIGDSLYRGAAASRVAVGSAVGAVVASAALVAVGSAGLVAVAAVVAAAVASAVG